MPKKRRSAAALSRELEQLRQENVSNRNRLSLLHELQVYQEELVVQNEELLRAQQLLEETRDRFVDLYEFAPHGYLTLDDQGIVLQINLTGAVMLGRSKAAVEGLPLLGLATSASRPTLLDFIRRCRRAGIGCATEAEVRLCTADGEREVQLLCRGRQLRTSAHREYLTAVIDITERRRLEREGEAAAQAHAALASRLISAQEDERHRIARDLHDDAGQQVTALRLKLETVLRELTGDTAAAVSDLRDLLQALDQRLHYLASDLRPAALDLGLAVALEQLVAQWSATFGVEAECDASALGNLRLSPEVETHVYRVAQEMLNNVAKHADASQVSVLLQQTRDGLLLVVEDNGRGFDVAHAHHQPQALGLVGMRERANLIDGRLEIESKPGTGTVALLRVPRSSTSEGNGKSSRSPASGWGQS